MATLVRWDPFREVEALHNEMSRRMNGAADGAPRNGQPWVPPMDVWETGTELIYEFELPGVPPNSVSVEVEDGTLSVSASRERTSSRDSIGRFERRYGTFSRTVGLPAGIVEDSIQAKHADGVLRIAVPKPEQPKPKRIEVKHDDRSVIEAESKSPA